MLTPVPVYTLWLAANVSQPLALHSTDAFTQACQACNPKRMLLPTFQPYTFNCSAAPGNGNKLHCNTTQDQPLHKYSAIHQLAVFRTLSSNQRFCAIAALSTKERQFSSTVQMGLQGLKPASSHQQSCPTKASTLTSRLVRW